MNFYLAFENMIHLFSWMSEHWPEILNAAGFDPGNKRYHSLIDEFITERLVNVIFRFVDLTLTVPCNDPTCTVRAPSVEASSLEISISSPSAMRRSISKVGESWLFSIFESAE